MATANAWPGNKTVDDSPERATLSLDARLPRLAKATSTSPSVVPTLTYVTTTAVRTIHDPCSGKFRLLPMASASSTAIVARMHRRSCGRNARTRSLTSFQRDKLRSVHADAAAGGDEEVAVVQGYESSGRPR
jgi:hypothetical protein